MTPDVPAPDPLNEYAIRLRAEHAVPLYFFHSSGCAGLETEIGLHDDDAQLVVTLTGEGNLRDVSEFLQHASRDVHALLAEVARLTEQLEDARRWAVHLEQENAKLLDEVAQWRDEAHQWITDPLWPFSRAFGAEPAPQDGETPDEARETLRGWVPYSKRDATDAELYQWALAGINRNPGREGYAAELVLVEQAGLVLGVVAPAAPAPAPVKLEWHLTSTYPIVHYFEPGISTDTKPGESGDPDWCNVCGEGRGPAPASADPPMPCDRAAGCTCGEHPDGAGAVPHSAPALAPPAVEAWIQDAVTADRCPSCGARLAPAPAPGGDE